MSDTPRTDAQEFEAEVHDSVMRRLPVFVVNVNFARELERESNRAKEAHAEVLNDDAFRILMALVMVNDPWPLQAGKGEIDDLLDDEARRRGFCDWIEAYHVWPGVI